MPMLSALLTVLSLVVSPSTANASDSLCQLFRPHRQQEAGVAPRGGEVVGRAIVPAVEPCHRVGTKLDHLDQLELTETWSVPLPDSLTIGGALVIQSGEVALWTLSPFSLLAFDGQSIQEIDAGFDPKGRGILPTSSSSGLEWFDGASGEIVGGGSGKPSVRARYEVPGIEIETAALTDDWVHVAGAHSAGYSIVTFDRGTAEIAARSEVPTGAAIPPHSSRLLVHQGDLFLSLLQYPFTIHRYAVDGDRKVFFSMLGSSLESERAFEGVQIAEWTSLAFIPLDRGFILQLTNPASDDRALLILDKSGRVMRSSLISAPIGFVAADPTTKLLFAIRSLNRRELVAYRWRWTPEDTTGSNRKELQNVEMQS